MIDWPPECPGGCGAPVKYGLSRHGKALRTCKCPDAIGRRNRKRGKAAQRTVHQILGGKGWTPAHEETARPYELELSVLPEAKAGAQIPQSFVRFTGTEWFRRAMSQSERAIPAGSNVLPALYLEPGGGGRWLIIKLG